MRRVILALLALLVLGVAGFWFVTRPSKVSADALPTYSPKLANGEVMFHIGGCNACHAMPNEEDKTKLGGGAELKSPYGSFYPPNISPDLRDGIGGWSEADFVTAMWKGTSPDGRHYFPAFPYPSYQRMKLEDVRDLFAYLKTLPPVQGKAARSRCALSVQYSPPGRRVEISLSRRQTVHARSQSASAVESRRLSGQRSGALRGMPQPAQRAWRDRRGAALRRRTEPGRGGLGSQHHPGRDRRLLGG